MVLPEATLLLLPLPLPLPLPLLLMLLLLSAGEQKALFGPSSKLVSREEKGLWVFRLRNWPLPLKTEKNVFLLPFIHEHALIPPSLT